MKILLKLILFLIILFNVSYAQESVVNFSLCQNVGTRIIETVDVDFEFTHNEILVYTNKTFRINSSRGSLIHIWDFEVTVDGNPYVFIKRPIIKDIETESGRKFLFEYEVSLNDDKFHIVFLKFNRNNVKQTADYYFNFIHPYPFDEYELKKQREIGESVNIVSHYKFPNVDIEIEPNITTSALLVPDLIFSDEVPIIELILPANYIEINNEIITSPIGVKNRHVCGINFSMIPISKTGKLEDPIGTKVIENPVELNLFNFSRTFFPSIFLFIILGTFVIFITAYYTLYKKSIGIINIFRKIYIVTSLPMIIGEFTVGILPPSRPLTITLFDTIIGWPIFLIPFFLFIKYVYKKIIKNGHNKVDELVSENEYNKVDELVSENYMLERNLREEIDKEIRTYNENIILVKSPIVKGVLFGISTNVWVVLLLDMLIFKQSPYPAITETFFWFITFGFGILFYLKGKRAIISGAYRKVLKKCTNDKTLTASYWDSFSFFIYNIVRREKMKKFIQMKKEKYGVCVED